MERRIRTLLAALTIALLLAAMVFAAGCATEETEPQEQTETEEPVSTEPAEESVEGQAVVEGACSQCHDATRIYLLQTEMPDWTAVISEMETAHGAVLTDEEKASVTAFLESRKADEAETLISGECTSCHDLSRIYLLQTEMPDWEAIVSRMTQEHGATLTPEEQAAIVEYLENR